MISAALEGSNSSSPIPTHRRSAGRWRTAASDRITIRQGLGARCAARGRPEGGRKRRCGDFMQCRRRQHGVRSRRAWAAVVTARVRRRSSQRRRVSRASHHRRRHQALPLRGPRPHAVGRARLLDLEKGVDADRHSQPEPVQDEANERTTSRRPSSWQTTCCTGRARRHRLMVMPGSSTRRRRHPSRYGEQGRR